MASLPPLRTKVGADTGAFTGGINSAVASLGAFKGALGATGVALAAFAGAKGLGAAVRAFADFDAAMTESQAIMGDLSQNTMAEMEQAALDVSTQTVASAEEAAESYFFLASAGLDAEQSIAALPAVAEFAQAGMFDMATATDLATDAQSALGLTSENTAENLRGLTRVTDVLVKSNQLANASVEQFADAITNKLGARLRLLNKDLEEGAAALAALADAGIKGRRAGTGLNIVYRDLVATAVENEAAFQRLGIEVFDAEGNMRNLADVVEDFEDVLGGATDQEKAAAFEMLGLNKRAQDFLGVLVGVSDEMREYERSVRDAGGATEEVAEKQLETLNKQMGLLSDEAHAAKVQLGGLIAPSLAKDVQAARIVLGRLRGELTGLLDDVDGEEGGEGPSVLDRVLMVSPGTLGALKRARDAWIALRSAILRSGDEAPAGEGVPLPQGPPAPEDGGEDGESAREKQRRKIAERRARFEEAVGEARQRLLEDELGLLSLSLEREEARLQKLIEEEATWRQIVAQAEKVAEIEDRLSQPPEVSAVGRDRFPDEGPSVPSLPDDRDAAVEVPENAAEDAVKDLLPPPGPFGDLETILQEGAIPALDQFASELGIGSSAVANLVDGLLTAIGKEFGDSEGVGGFLASLAGGFAGGFQGGGRIPAGKVGLVHAGETLAQGPARVTPGGGSVNITVRTEVRALDARGVDRVLRQSGQQAIVDAVVRATSMSEGVSRALVTGGG